MSRYAEGLSMFDAFRRIGEEAKCCPNIEKIYYKALRQLLAFVAQVIF